MELKSVEFDTTNNLLKIVMWDGVNEGSETQSQYFDRAGLVADYPEFERFAAGMGWV